MIIAVPLDDTFSFLTRFQAPGSTATAIAQALAVAEAAGNTTAAAASIAEAIAQV